MHKLIAWAKDHKGLAIALGIGVLVLLYLMFRGGGNANAGGTSALSAYYAAEGASQQAAAQVADSQNALAANTNQVNASAATAQSYLDALKSIAGINAATQTHAIDAQEAIDMAEIAAATPKPAPAGPSPYQQAVETAYNNDIVYWTAAKQSDRIAKYNSDLAAASFLPGGPNAPKAA